MSRHTSHAPRLRRSCQKSGQALWICCGVLLARMCLGGTESEPANVRDVRQWHERGLPMAAEWNVEGYAFDYHVNQLREGHRFLPSVKLPAASERQATKPVGGSPWSWEYLREARAPLCLRTNNICNSFVSPDYRLPVEQQSIPRSPLAWRIVDGKLKESRVVDCFGPVSNWESEGKLWGSSPWMNQIQHNLPNPPYVIFLENNEGAYESLEFYTTRSKDTKALVWKSSDDLAAKSLRMRDRVSELLAADPNAAPHDFLPEFWERRRAQYAALYTAFDASLTEPWRDKTYRVGYKAMKHARNGKPPRLVEALDCAPALRYYDAGSEPVYNLLGRLTDFTSPNQLGVLNLIPAWKAARAENPKSFRELSLHISAGSTFAGALDGRHEVITPARYEGFVQWLLWSIHDPGVAVILRRWCPAGERPNSPLYRQDQQDRLDDLRAPELKSATSATYLQPVVSAVDRVCTEPTLRDFWLRGQPVIVPGPGHPLKQLDEDRRPYPRPGDPDDRWRFLECSANPPRDEWIVRGPKPGNRNAALYAPNLTIKVWCVATRLDDQALVFVWTPCLIEGRITVTVPGFAVAEIDVPQPWGYWIVHRNGGAKPLIVE